MLVTVGIGTTKDSDDHYAFEAKTIHFTKFPDKIGYWGIQKLNDVSAAPYLGGFMLRNLELDATVALEGLECVWWRVTE